MAIRTVGISC